MLPLLPPNASHDSLLDYYATLGNVCSGVSRKHAASIFKVSQFGCWIPRDYDVDNAGRLQGFHFQVILKMESACSSEIPEQTYYPKRCNSPEEYHLIKPRRENLKA
jgi:hypothetical protein